MGEVGAWGLTVVDGGQHTVTVPNEDGTGVDNGIPLDNHPPSEKVWVASGPDEVCGRPRLF